MSISNNTAGLQEILRLVNNLPEAGTGGVTYIMRGIIPEVASYIGDVEMEGE